MNIEKIKILRVYLENMVSDGLKAQKIGTNFSPSQIVDESIVKIVKFFEEDTAEQIDDVVNRLALTRFDGIDNQFVSKSFGALVAQKGTSCSS